MDSTCTTSKFGDINLISNRQGGRQTMQRYERVGIAKWVVAVGVIAAMIMAGCASSAPSSSSADNAAPMAGAAESPAMEPVAQAEGSTNVASSSRKIIARAGLTLVVVDTEVAVGEITALMDELGGYVSTTNLYRNSYNNNNSLQGSITLRVPSENLDAALTALGEMAVEVNSRTLNREDVTDQYSDVDAQIRNLEATERELLAMLEEVRERPNSTTEDIMSVYRTLTEVRGQIETLRGRKNMWDNLISLSTIDVTLVPDSAALPVVDEGWRPSAVAREAQRALVATVQVLGNVLIWVGIYALPLLILALIPLVLLILVVRWGIRRVSKPKPTLPTAPPPAPSA